MLRIHWNSPYVKLATNGSRELKCSKPLKFSRTELLQCSINRFSWIPEVEASTGHRSRRWTGVAREAASYDAANFQSMDR